MRTLFITLLLLISLSSYSQVRLDMVKTPKSFKSLYKPPKWKEQYINMGPVGIANGRIIVSTKSNTSFMLATRIPLNSFYSWKNAKVGFGKFFRHLVFVVPRPM